MPAYMLITNPFSSRGLSDMDVGRAVELLTAARGRVDVVNTRGPGDAAKAVRDRKRDYIAIVVAGGDGTINEVINGLDGHHIPIGIIPRGTANVLAHELEIPHGIEAAVRVIAEGKELPLDVGLAGKRRFMLMASAGFDAQVVERAHRKRKTGFGYTSYLLPVWRTFLEADFPEIAVEIHQQEYRCRHAVVANVSTYGGPFRPAPGAIYNDGEFDVVLYMRPGRWNMLRYGKMALCCSDKAADNDILRLRAKTVTLSSDGRVPLQCDGDPIGSLPCNLRVLGDAVNFIVP